LSAGADDSRLLLPSSIDSLLLQAPLVKSGYLSEIFASFQGEGLHVGRRHLFVRLAGCNLRCRYCDTPDSLVRTPGYTVYGKGDRPARYANPVSSAEVEGAISALLEADAPIDALAFTGGEPLLQSEFLAEVLSGGKFSLPVLLETNGMLPDRLRDLLALVDIVSMDIKPPSNTGEPAYWSEHAAFIELARCKELYAKILVDQTTTDEDIERAVGLLAPAVPTFLQPIVDPGGRPMIDAARLSQVYAVARRSLDTVRVLPQTHKLLGIR
jgi:7-carboxy-7-deazaguanine synthase